MRGRHLPLSAPRRFLVDLLRLAARVPTVPVERRMPLAAVAAARAAADPRPGWPAVFVKSYARVAADLPALRRAYLGLPWPHLREYPDSVASVAVERRYGGDPAVFFGRLRDPAGRPLADLDAEIKHLAAAPVDQVKAFRRLVAVGRLPGPVRRRLLWLGLNLPRSRPTQFGTFGLTAYSSLGSASLHPLSPLTTTLTYGVVGPDGRADVRLIYDHRVLDGPTVARALAALEAELTGPTVAELRGMAPAAARRAA